MTKVLLMLVAIGCLAASAFSDVSPTWADYVILAILLFMVAEDE